MRTTRDRGPPPRPLSVVHERTSEWANRRTHRVVPRSVEPPDDDEKDDEDEEAHHPHTHHHPSSWSDSPYSLRHRHSTRRCEVPNARLTHQS